MKKTRNREEKCQKGLPLWHFPYEHKTNIDHLTFPPAANAPVKAIYLQRIIAEARPPVKKFFDLCS